MNNVREFSRGATIPDAVGLNGPATAQGLLASLCLLGFSSSPNSSWLAYFAAGVFLYTIFVVSPFRRLVSSALVWQSLFRWAPRLAGFGAIGTVSMFLADEPMPVAAVGSLTLIGLMALSVAGLLLMAARCAAWLAGRVRTASIGQRLRVASQLAWLAITQ